MCFSVQDFFFSTSLFFFPSFLSVGLGKHLPVKKQQLWIQWNSDLLLTITADAPCHWSCCAQAPSSQPSCTPGWGESSSSRWCRADGGQDAPETDDQWFELTSPTEKFDLSVIAGNVYSFDLPKTWESFSVTITPFLVHNGLFVFYIVIMSVVSLVTGVSLFDICLHDAAVLSDMQVAYLWCTYHFISCLLADILFRWSFGEGWGSGHWLHCQ